MNKKHALFIGRWQPFHNGHRWLIDQKLKQGIPCVVAIRDIPPDKNNPYTVQETSEMLHKAFEGEDVEIIIIPDIESVNYGRGVGYDIVEHVPPPDIERVSATEIRNKIKNGDNSWWRMVDPKIIGWLEDYYETTKN
jgi:cytidyltransferase-like protein